MRAQRGEEMAWRWALFASERWDAERRLGRCLLQSETLIIRNPTRMCGALPALSESEARNPAKAIKSRPKDDIRLNTISQCWDEVADAVMARRFFLPLASSLQHSFDLSGGGKCYPKVSGYHEHKDTASVMTFIDHDGCKVAIVLFCYHCHPYIACSGFRF